jgi:hypothetical protein
LTKYMLNVNTAASGPKGPFSNIPPALESQIEFIADAIERAEQVDAGSRQPIEATHEAERAYSAECDKLAASSLFWNAAVSILQSSGMVFVNTLANNTVLG